MKLGIASTDWSRTVFNNKGPVPGGANYIRLQQWLPHSGVSFVSGYLASHPKEGLGVVDATGKMHWDCDVLVVQRVMFKQLAEQMQDSNYRKIPVINEIDDWYWGIHEENIASKPVQPENSPDENIDHYKKIIQLSDGVVTSTPFLHERMVKDFGCDPSTVHIIENCVSTDKFKTRNMTTKKPILGWVGSTNHRSGDLAILKPVLEDGYYRVHHSGHHGNAPTFSNKVGISSSRVSCSPLIAPSNYGQNSFIFDIGLAPLNDIPFNHAKSWIKAIEYAAAGIPFVASDLPEYRRLHDKYGIGRLASSPEEWRNHIDELANFETRKAEGQRVREVVTMNLDVKKMASNYMNVIKNFV